MKQLTDLQTKEVIEILEFYVNERNMMRNIAIYGIVIITNQKLC